MFQKPSAGPQLGQKAFAQAASLFSRLGKAAGVNGSRRLDAAVCGKPAKLVDRDGLVALAWELDESAMAPVVPQAGA